MRLDLAHHHTDLRLIEFLLHLLITDGILVLLTQIQDDPYDLIQHSDRQTEIIEMQIRKIEILIHHIQQHGQG